MRDDDKMVPLAVARAAPRFRLVKFDQIAPPAPGAYLVKGLVPTESLIVIWGPPKCGKTFWAFDVSMHVALGRNYRGRHVRRGAVVYIACEGERGLAARAEAYRIAHLSDQEAADFYLLTTRLDLVADANLLIGDIRMQLGDEPCAAIVIDTLNRSLAGSESSDEDMSAYIKAADLVREAFRCAVVVIHHCGIDDRRPRGHTSLAGAADVQIGVKRDASDAIVATIDFAKDGEAGAEIRSTLRTIDLGRDDDGAPITSCVIEPATGAAAPLKRGPKVTGAAKIALDLLRKAINEAGEIPPANNHTPSNVRAVQTDLWRKYCYQGAITEGDSQARQKAFKRAAGRLQELGAIATWDDWVWPVK